MSLSTSIELESSAIVAKDSISKKNSSSNNTQNTSAEFQVTDAMIASLVDSGKANKVEIDSKLSAEMEKLTASAFGSKVGVKTDLAESYKYFCRNADGSGSYLYETQINLRSSYRTESLACVQVAN